MALKRLEFESEGAFVEIQAWRRAYAKMGLKPTQYRCAAEALLRRLRKSGDLPKLHPLIDLCNAVSVAFAVPVAVFDMDRISGDLCVRPADGDETYLAFSGQSETPDPGEVIFADYGGHAHARRWANRQSLSSAVSPKTTRALIVAVAQHEDAADQMLVHRKLQRLNICQPPFKDCETSVPLHPNHEILRTSQFLANPAFRTPVSEGQVQLAPQASAERHYYSGGAASGVSTSQRRRNTARARRRICLTV
ncbi:B3/4 domain-containing protein [Ruegeria sp. R13_0]|uniref:B3/B4 domain-containing protein n=1 Tax=Ruegeria sp. R13_0 TaxID=2821099 RepID=UPI001FFE16D8|nr:phenylalanine--tRNA ligase beta subunit-related protein [Ruegeria sp. R13_0]